MSSPKPLEQPSHVAAEQGEVLVDGPNGIALSLTPEAAEKMKAFWAGKLEALRAFLET